MTRFGEIKKDLDLFAYIVYRAGRESPCSFCFYQNKTLAECKNRCRKGIQKYFKQEVK